MKESVAIAKKADTTKNYSPTKNDSSNHRAQHELGRQIAPLRGVIGNIQRDCGKPSVESIATQLGSISAAQRAPALLALQQTHGNHYVQRVVTGIQAKLVVGQPGDKYEQEADRVADEVMRMPEPQVQRQEEPEEEEETLQAKPLAEQITPLVQRQVEPEEEEELLQVKKTGSVTPEVTPAISSGIQSLQGGGRPLSGPERSFFEPRFGADFSNVRVHNDTQAANVARSVNARAFTYGHNVVFGAGEYSSDTFSGRKLLAHELTHVVQQNDGLYLFSEGNNSENTIPNSQEVGIVSPELQLQSQTSMGPRLQRRAIAVQNGPGVTPIDTNRFVGMEIDVHFLSTRILGGWAPASRVIYKEEVSEPLELTGSFVEHPPPDVSQDQHFLLRLSPDRHAISRSFLIDHVRNYGAGCFTLYQLDRFRDRPDSTPYVIRYSGYKIEHCVERPLGERADADVDLDDTNFTVHKTPVTCTVRSYSAEAGHDDSQELNPEYNVSVPIMRTMDSSSIEPDLGDVRIQRYVSPEPDQPFEEDPNRRAAIELPERWYRQRGLNPPQGPTRFYDDATLYGSFAGPMPEHVQQGGLGDCWFALAGTDRGRSHIISHIRPNHDISPTESRTYTVTLYRFGNSSNGEAIHYRMEPELPAGVASVHPRAIYPEGQQTRDGGILWVALYERAMAHHHQNADSYERLETPGLRSELAFDYITGIRSAEYWSIGYGMMGTIRRAFNRGQPVVISTKGEVTSPYRGHHGYGVVDARENQLSIRNPQGSRGGNNPIIEVDQQALEQYFNYVAIGEHRPEYSAERQSGGCECRAPSP